MRAEGFNRLLCRILVLMMIAGSLQGLGPLSGQVSADAAYTVTYDGNGNDGGSVPVDITGYETGDLAIVHDNSNGLTKDGFIFGGWNTKADGTGTDYFPGQTFAMGTQNVTLYAKWINTLASWSDRSSTSSNLNAIAYGNGAFYAVGKSGLIVSSIDGTIWTKQTSVTTRDLYNIASVNGKLIAIGANGTILVSDNGEDWSYRHSGTTSTLRGITYGNGLYLAVGDGGTIVTSRNGSFWEVVASGTANKLNDAVYANGKFIVVGDKGTILTSTDGQEWSPQMGAPGLELTGVAAGGGRIVAVGAGATVVTSEDGSNWTNRINTISSELSDVAYVNGKFVALGSLFSEINHSTDGISWSSEMIDFSAWKGVAYGNGLYVAIGSSNIATSTNLTNWTKYQHPSLNGVAYGNGMFVAAGTSGKIYSSANGAKWQKQTSNTTNALRGITYGNGLFVAVGDSGTILTSGNGADWTVRTSPVSKKLSGVTYGNGRFVAVGESGTVVYSVNGEDWTLSGTGFPELDLHAVAYGLGQFVAVGPTGTDNSGNGMIYTSADGQNWESNTVSDVELYSIAASDTLIVAAGLSTDGDSTQNVYISGDGSSWNRISSNAGQQINGIAYDNGTFVLAGNGGTVRISKDGTSYSSAASGISTALQAVAGGGGTFVAAGQSGAMVQTRKEAPINYTIHFYENGGDAKASPPFMMLLPGESIGALPAPLSRAGYVFAGWNTKPDGSGTAIDESYALEADTFAYAQWAALPSVPVNLTGTSGDSEITLSWDAATGAASYAIYQHEGTSAPTDPGQWVLVEDNLAATTYTVTGLVNGKSYVFTVKAFNAAGSSDFSAALTVKAGGHGTADDPYIIKDAKRLAEVSQDLDAYYVLLNDIDLSDPDSGYDDWTPIGVESWEAKPFTGHFDGNGHTISGLTAANNDSGYIGLFGIIGSGGLVQNLVLSDVNISASGGFDTGALAGNLGGSAINIRVTGGTVAGGDKVGGLVGSASGGAKIQASCTNLQVVGLTILAEVGGLVGDLSGSEISESCSAGEVSGGWFTGGLIGIITDSQIINSYATGSVTGADAVGGLVGGLGSYSEGVTPPSTLTNVYAAGKVTGSPGTNLGGLIGRKYDEIHLNSAYYDKDNTGQSDEEEYSGTPLSHDEMGKEASFEDWDFDTIWHLDDRDGTPTFLRDDSKEPEMSGAKITNDSPNQVVVYFPEKIAADEAALSRFSVTVNGSEAQITGKQLSGKELTLTLGQPVVYGQEVKVSYTDGDPAVTDKAQNRMSSQTELKAVNEVKPHVAIVSYSPADDETGVAADKQLNMTFNFPVEAISGKYIYLMTAGGDIAEKIEATNTSQVHVDGTEVTITLSNHLLPFAGYYVLIDPGAFQQSADSLHGGISDPAVWNFMTAPEPGADWFHAGYTGFTEGKVQSPVLKAGADGTLYVLFRDEAHDGKATVMKLGASDAAWSLVGSAGFSPGAIGVPSLLVDGDELYAAFGVVDENDISSVHVMKYELGGTGDWTPAADPIEVGVFDKDKLWDQDSTPFILMHNGAVHVAYRDGTLSGRITVKKLTAGGWETVGNEKFSAGDIYDPSLAVLDGVLYAGYTDYMYEAGFGATVMKFNPVSESWELVGSRGFTPDYAFDTTLVTDGKRLYVAYENEGEGAHKASAMYFDPDKGEWAPVGSGSFSSGQAYGIAAAAENGELYAAYQDAKRSSKLTVMKYAGSGWVPVGTSGFTPEEAYNPSLIIHDGILYVAYEDPASFGKLTVLKYGAFGSEPIYSSAISPETAKFNKSSESKDYADLKTAVKLNGNELTGIQNGSTPLMEGTDYTVSNNSKTVTIRKEYLSQQPIGTTNLTFKFSEGVSRNLKITIVENSSISPATANFDKYEKLPAYADVTTTLTLRSNTFSGIYNYKDNNDDLQLTEGTDYTVDGDIVTIKKEYLAQLPVGTTELTFSFSAGDPQILKIKITDSTPAAVPNLQLAEAGNAQVTLEWSPAIGATGYKVYLSVTAATYGDVVATVSGAVYSYTVTGLTNGVTYYFAVKSVKSDIDSDFSNVLSATPITVPSAPTNVTAVAGDREATVTFTESSDNGGSEITGYEVTVAPGGEVVTGTASPMVITGLTNGIRYTFTIRAVNAAGKSEPAESNAVVPFSPSSDDDDEPSDPDDNSVTVLVNGKEEKAGTATTTTRDGQIVTTIAIDPAKLDERLAEEGLNAIVTIPVPSGADVAVGELNGQMVKNMEDKQAILEIKTDRATYTLPAQQINIKTISAKMGASVALQDIKIQVEIGAPAADKVKLVENAEAEGTFTLVVPPVEFTVKATYGETTIEVSRFDVYVERAIAIPDGVDPDKITTGVVVEPDGSVRHVPTKVVMIDGKYFAKINSLTNSTYTVVWNPREFADVASHWAKDTVNNMGSRMIIEGTGSGLFSPDRDITRAEFAAIIVRALGLGLEQGTSVFRDVKESDWYNRAIRTAYAYGLLGGFEDGTFRPNDKITREQAMVIIAKAMDITGLKAKLPKHSANETLRKFADAAKVSGWAISSIADCVQAGIVSGRSGNQLAPKDTITRAEAAAMIERLLQKSDLI